MMIQAYWLALMGFLIFTGIRVRFASGLLLLLF